MTNKTETRPMGDYTRSVKHESIQVPEKLYKRIEGLATVLNMGTGVLTATVMESYLNQAQAELERLNEARAAYATTPKQGEA